MLFLMMTLISYIKKTVKIMKMIIFMASWKIHFMPSEIAVEDPVI